MKPIERTRQEVFERWVKALESGKYQQTQGQLRDINEDGESSFCCLGVLCHLAEKDGGQRFDGPIYDGECGMPPNYILEFMFEDAGVADELAEMNDTGYTFKEIAKHIREHFMKEFKSV
jgi:hypothetical protein